MYENGTGKSHASLYIFMFCMFCMCLIASGVGFYMYYKKSHFVARNEDQRRYSGLF
jgi:hypothetical protein